MRFELRFDIFTTFMILGVFQGIFLTYLYFTKQDDSKKQNFFFALLMITLVVIDSEILLNYSGLIVKVIWIENYSEPFVFLLAPLMFLFIRSGLGHNYEKDDWVHFFPFAFYFVYCIFYFVQPPEFKFNSYVYCYQSEWQMIDANMRIPVDPLGLRSSLEQLYLIQFLIYLILIYQQLRKYAPSKMPNSGLGASDYKNLYHHWIHFLIVAIIITFVKSHFERDYGDYIIGSYMSLLIYVTSFVTLKRILIHKQSATDEVEKVKYEKSSLSEEQKEHILTKLTELLDKEKYFKSNIVSLSSTASRIAEPSHHVSQVINEKLGMTFFDMLARYRVEEAKYLLTQPDNKTMTIEEVAELVGYNSKAAFNKAFKKLTDSTPSEYRDQNT